MAASVDTLSGLRILAGLWLQACPRWVWVRWTAPKLASQAVPTPTHCSGCSHGERWLVRAGVGLVQDAVFTFISIPKAAPTSFGFAQQGSAPGP